MGSSIPDEPGPGIAVEGARLLRSGDEAEHARHRQVLARLDRVIELLAELVLVLQPQAKGPSVPLEDVFREAKTGTGPAAPAAPAPAASRRRPAAR